MSFSKFCGLSLEQSAPDHSTLSRFRSEMIKVGGFEKLFKLMNKQLEKHKIIVKTGAIVDASITDSPLKPKGKPVYEIAIDREDTTPSNEEIEKKKQEIELIKKLSPG